ncbi:MAG: HD domain-containing protein [Dehalococcoidia bacterium]|nr:MAG: HD domain-containing protein [Dehalococcoidia bacterium]
MSQTSQNLKTFPVSFFAKEHKFDSLVESLNNLGIGLNVINKEMRIVWANRIITDIFGPAEKIYGRHCYKIYAHRKKVCPNCPSAKVFRTGMPGFKAIERGIDKDGKKQYHKLISTPIKNNGRIVEALELVQDVTKEVVAERQRARFHNQLKELNLKFADSNRQLTLKTRRLSKASAKVKELNCRLKEEVQNKSLELGVAMKELNTVYTVSREIISTLDLQEVFSLITKTVCLIIKTRACILRMVDRNSGSMSIVSSHGLSAKYIDNTPLKIGEGLAGIIAATKQPIVCPRVSKEESIKYSYYINREGYQSALGVPVVFNGKVLGSIVTYDGAVRNYTKIEIMLLSTFASQVAVAIRNAHLYQKVHLTYLDTVNSLALAVEARDPYTLGHSERVTGYAIELAAAVGLPKKEIEIIRNSGKLHDLGKIAVPDSILRKSGPLTEDERRIIQTHPDKGINMLAPLKFLASGLPLIRHHHERFDGSGYPQGLKKTKIPFIVRIFSCADAFDAMTSDRPYRPKLTFKKAIEQLEENAGSQFDPYLVKKFVRILKRKNVKLN